MEPAKGSTLDIPQSPRLAGSISGRASRAWDRYAGHNRVRNFNNEAHSGPMAADYEKLGLFYLGKRYNLSRATPAARTWSCTTRKDLVTHAVCVGMTGSGKTGLGITLIEEAALETCRSWRSTQRAISPTCSSRFPISRRPISRRGSIAGEASRKQVTVDAYAADIAKRWKAGLAEWDQDGSRIAQAAAAADVRVYTPGSRAATPLAILGQTGQSRHEDRGRCAGPDRGDRGGAAWSRGHDRCSATQP